MLSDKIQGWKFFIFSQDNSGSDVPTNSFYKISGPELLFTNDTLFTKFSTW